MFSIFSVPLPVWIAIGFLGILTVIDILTFNKKSGSIPAVITTLFLILTFALSPFPQGLYIGVVAFLIGIMFVDLDLFGGVADLKIIVALSFTFLSLIDFIFFALAVTFFSTIYKYSIKKYITKGKERDIPFIPVYLIAYLVMLLWIYVLK